MDQRPLKEVVADLFGKQKVLNDLDDKISMAIATLERRLRALSITRVYSAKLPDGADLGWSLHRNRRSWRFVIRAGDDVWELRNCSREERAEVFSCGAMARLVQQALQEKGATCPESSRSRSAAKR